MTVTSDYIAVSVPEDRLSPRRFGILCLFFAAAAVFGYTMRELLLPTTIADRVLILPYGESGNISFLSAFCPQPYRDWFTGFVCAISGTALEFAVLFAAGLTAFPHLFFALSALWHGVSFGCSLSLATGHMLSAASPLALPFSLLSTGILFIFAAGPLPGLTKGKRHFLPYLRRFLVCTGMVFSLQAVVIGFF